MKIALLLLTFFSTVIVTTAIPRGKKNYVKGNNKLRGRRLMKEEGAKNRNKDTGNDADKVKDKEDKVKDKQDKANENAKDVHKVTEFYACTAPEKVNFVEYLFVDTDDGGFQNLDRNVGVETVGCPCAASCCRQFETAKQLICDINDGMPFLPCICNENTFANNKPNMNSNQDFTVDVEQIETGVGTVYLSNTEVEEEGEPGVDKPNEEIEQDEETSEVDETVPTNAEEMDEMEEVNNEEEEEAEEDNNNDDQEKDEKGKHKGGKDKGHKDNRSKDESEARAKNVNDDRAKNDREGIVNENMSVVRERVACMSRVDALSQRISWMDSRCNISNGEDTCTDGCCRITHNDVLQCDQDNTMFLAQCICNSFTTGGSP